MSASRAGELSGNSVFRRLQQLEWPTIVLGGVIYAGWLAATFWHDRLPTLLLVAIGGWLVAWHGSLQHEAIHGHPTPWPGLNTALITPPLSLWLPYEIYRRSHMAHHATEHLSHPTHDPEARYLAPGERRRDKAVELVAKLQSTLAGRLVLGPLIEASGFLIEEGRRVWQGEAQARQEWAWHLVLVAAVLAWLHFACGMSLGEYLLCFVYPGLALTLIRSFAEHRAGPSPGGRVAVVENAPLLGLLFLNNNLHAAHHAWPGLPWWRLPERYRQERAALLAASGGLVYAGYRDVFARFFLRPHDTIIHPSLPPSPESAAS